MRLSYGIEDAGDGHRRLCGDALRSGHRREDDIRRFKYHAVCGFSLERISTTKLVFGLYMCKGFAGCGRKVTKNNRPAADTIKKK